MGRLIHHRVSRQSGGALLLRGFHCKIFIITFAVPDNQPPTRDRRSCHAKAHFFLPDADYWSEPL